MAAKSKIPKNKKPKVTDDAAFGDCPTYHFLAGSDRVKKVGTATWKFCPDQYIGVKAKYVAEAGYQVQRNLNV